MRKLTRKQILARLFIGFFAVASIFYESSSVWSADYGTYTINNGAANTLTEAGITPANKSENKLDVSIITGTGSIADIYGGYSDATDDVCSNTVHIKSSEGSGIALTNVYGGYTYKSGDASYNEVNISSSTVNQSVFGGVTGFATDGAEETNYGNAIGNKVNISSSTVALYVFGGIASDTGDASYNEVTVASSTVKKMIYGGYAYGAGNAEGNKVAVTNNSSLNSTVYAGRSFNTGDAASNEITVDNSKTKALYAGYSKIGSSTLNLINIDNSSATSIYVGYVSNTGNADENTLYIFNSSLSGSAYAGRTATGSANLNTVSIASSSVSTSIYSGYVYTLGDASKNKAIIASSTINNSIYGGYVNGSGNASENEVTVASSTVVSYSYGGYVNGRGDAANNKIEIIDSHLDNSAIGGDVEIEGNAVNNEVITNNSIIKGNVHGGRLASGTAINNVVNIDNSVIEKSVYGGYLSYGISADNTVNISSSTVNTSVYGSYSSSGNSSENTVDIGSSTINTSVYGGYSTKGSCNNIVDVTNSIVNNSVFGGHSSSGSSTYNIVDIASSTVNVSVYGAEITSSGDAENNSVNITDTTVVKEIYGAYTSYYGGTEGNAIENEVYISNSKIKSKVYGGLTGVKGDAIGNKITIASSTVGGRVYAGSSGLYLSTLGDAIDNHLVVTDSKMSAEIYGGLVFGGTSTQNIVDVSSSTVGIIYGGYIGSGGVLLDNEVNIECSKTGTVYGGIAYSKGNAEHNIVNIASSTTNTVYGGYSANGNTSRNIVNIYDNTSASSVYGGRSSNDWSIQNVVNISSGSVKTHVYGGYATTDTVENSVDIADGTVGNNVYGGCSSQGVSKQNTVEISNSSIGGNVFGGFVYNGSSTQNIVNISGSSLNGNAYGGVASTTGDAVGNEITITDSTVNQSVHGGYAVNGDTTHNVVNIASATLKQSVFGGKTTTGSANQNIINISNSSVSYDVYGGYSSSGKTNNNTICIENGAVIDGNVFGGSDTDKTGNKLIISGEGNIIGGITGNFESLSLDASTVHAGDTMLALTTDTAFDINVNKIETTDVNLSDGESITLISSTADNTFNGNIVYKVNGKQTFDTGSGKYISNFASEDSDRVVHIKEYSYVKDDNDLKLCNKEFISALYKGKDADGNLQNLGDADKPEIVIDSAPGVSKIYGSFSELPGTIAGGGVAITLSAAELDLSDADIIGSCNIADPTNIDVTNNTLNVEANGIKVKNIEGFENVNLKMAAEDTANLIVNSINLDYANINTEFSEGFIGTKSIISSDNAISQNSTTYRINGETLTGDRKYHMAKANETNVTIGTYKYNTSDANAISITGDALIAGIYRNGSQQLSAAGSTLVVDSAIASSYNDVYGAYSADGSDATGATVKLSEKLDAENLTIHSGYSTNTSADTKTGNTFEIAAAGAGSKVKEVRGFEKYSISLATDMPADTSMLHAVSINLDNASVETELSNSFNGTKSIISSDNAISQNSTTYKINGEILTGDRKYHMAKANETNVTIGTYKYNTSDANVISITGDSLVASVYRNGSQQLSAAGNTLVVDSAIASSYNDVYGAYSADGSDATGATVRLSEKLEAENLTIHSGYSTNTGADTKTGNTFEIAAAGAGSKVKEVRGFDKYTISLAPDMPAETSMLHADSINLDNTSVEAELNSGFSGTKAVISSDNAISQNSTTYKINGETLTGDRKYHMAKANDTCVTIGTYQYNTSDANVISITGDSLVAGVYRNGSQQLSAAGSTLVVDSAIASSYNDVYGAYSADGSDATGATVKLSEKLDAENLTIHSGYSTNTSADTKTGNTFEIAAAGAGSKVKEVRGFEKYTISLAPDMPADTSMLHADSINLDNSSVEAELNSGFSGTKAVISSDNAISQNSTTYKINGETLTGDRKYHMAKANDTSVTIGTYQYNTSDANVISITGDSLVAGVYRNGSQQLSAAGNTLVVDSAIASSYNDVYGAYSADGSDATGATVRLSEKLDAENLTIHSGYSTNTGADTKTGNTFEIAAAGAGSKVKEVRGFEKYSISLAPDMPADTSMLHAVSINLDNASVETELSNGFNGTKSIISSDNAISQNSTTYRINGETLTGDRKYHMAKANETNVTIGTYKYNTSDANAISITGDALIAGIYRNGSQQLSAAGSTLVVDSAIASSYNDVYGAYSADGSDATGATVRLSEKLDAENLTIHSGYSTNTGADTKTGNTFEIAAAGAGSKVKEVRGFEKYSISLAPDMSADTSMLHAVSINLDNASVETELSNGFSGTKAVISSDNAISQNSTTYKINGETLTGDRKYHMAKANDTNVTIGTYKYNTSDSNVISITGDSLVAGVYRNGSQQLSAASSTLVVDSAIASSYNDVYGAYSADGSDATGATVKLSEKLDAENLTIHSGYSTNTGADTKTGNTLIVEKSGNRVKGADGFSTIQFSTDSLVDSGNSVLTTSDKVNLEGVVVNADMTDVALNKGEKIVLLDNTENKASKLLIDGMEGDKQSAKENKDYVSITRIGYADETDKVAVEHKESVAAGKYVDENNRSLGKDKLILGSSATNSKSESVRGAAEPVISEFEDIYGVYSSGGVALGGATVEIVSAVDYGNTIIHGGYNTAQGLTAVGNTLNVKALNAKVKGITHFENMGFVLPPETRNGSTMLKVTETVDMSPTKKVDVDAVQAVMLRAGDSVNLITGEAGIVNFGNQQINISGLTDKVAEVGIYDKSLVLSVESEKQNQNTKAPVEGIAAAMANITAANDLTSNRLSENMITVAANGIGGNFAAMNGGHNKFNTGSYVEANSWNLGFGVGKKGLLKNNPDSTVGLFVQYGRSTFSTHNDDFRGDGNSRLLGAGIMVHHEGSGRFYHSGNLYAGKINTTWNSIAGGYDDSAPYFGFTIGVGSKHNVGSNRVMDVYGRYSFNHVGAMEGNLGGYSYHFNSADSSNLRLGLRMDYLKKNGSKAYWGLAWEHEFAGDCGAYMNLGPTESPSLNGNTGIVEVGYEWNQGNWNYNLNAEGNFGKREGVVGSFNVNYNFD